jgi:hypothetical protein
MTLVVTPDMVRAGRLRLIMPFALLFGLFCVILGLIVAL